MGHIGNTTRYIAAGQAPGEGCVTLARRAFTPVTVK